jgi:hypothetical protein
MPALNRQLAPKLVVIAAVLSFTLAGCTSSKQAAIPTSFGPLFPSVASASAPAAAASPGASSAASVPTASPAPTTPAGPPATARLTAIALQPSDFTPDWAASAPTPDPNEAAESASLAHCVGGRDTYADQTGDANSPDYTLGTATISSDASSFKSQADIAADVAIITSSKISACYEQLARTQLLASLPGGSTINTESVVITPGTGGGPSNVVANGAGTFNVTVNGALSNLYVNVAFITGPLTEAEVDFANVGAPVSPTIRAPLIAKVAARAAAVPSA